MVGVAYEIICHNVDTGDVYYRFKRGDLVTILSGHQEGALGLTGMRLRAVNWPHGCVFRRVGKLPILTATLAHSVTHGTVGAVDHPVVGAIMSYEIIQPFRVPPRWHRPPVNPILYCGAGYLQ